MLERIDKLNFDDNSSIKEKIGDETIYFSDKVKKVHKSLLTKIQDRNFIITDQAVYNFKNNELKRRIKIEDLKCITVSKLSEQFIIHGSKGEYDYLFVSPERKKIITILQTVYETLTHKNLLFCIKNDKDLSKLVVSKKDRKKNRNLFKIEKKELMSIKEFIDSDGSLSINTHPNSQKLEDEFKKNNKYQEGISFSDFKIYSLIGQGNTANVYLADHGGEMVALKVIDKAYVFSNGMIDKILLEKNILSSFNNEKNLSHMKFFFMTNNKICFVLPFYSCGELKNRDKKKKKNLSLVINREKKYKDKNIQKTILKRNEQNNKPSGNKKMLKEKNNISQRNIKKNYLTIHYKYAPKKFQSIQHCSNIDFSNNLYSSLGPYSNILNGRGGFCTKISYINSKRELYKNHNHIKKNNKLYKDFLHKFINIKNNGTMNKKAILLNLQNNIKYKNYDYKKKSKDRNNHFNNVNKNKNKSNSKEKNKLNISEINNNLKYLKLNNQKYNYLVEEKENVNDSKNKKINSFNEEYNKICENEHFCFDKTPPKTNINNRNNDLLLITQVNEQFSMNNDKKKTFNDLCQIENILINYYPTSNSINRNINDNSKSFIINNSVCSNQAELTIINNSHSKINLNLIGNENENDNTKRITLNNNDDILNDLIKNENEKNNNNISNNIVSNDSNILNNINNFIINDDKKEIIKEINTNEKTTNEKMQIFDENNNKEDYNNKDDIKIENNDNKSEIRSIIISKENIRNDNNNGYNNDIKDNSLLNDKNENEKNDKDITDNKDLQNIINKNNIIDVYGVDEDKNENDDEKINNSINDKTKKVIEKENNCVNLEENNINKENKATEKENEKKEDIINNNNSKEAGKSQDKNSNRFQKFKKRLMKKLGNELKKGGDKHNVSDNILKMAFNLEAKIGNKNEEEQKGPNNDISNNNKSKSENKNNIEEIMNKKPVKFNKKKTKKIVFFE